jgi:excisionase family DNA binding protein
MDKLLLRPPEAAEVLGLGRSKVYALLATGELPSIRVGGSLRVPVEALRRWLDQRLRSAAEAGARGGRPR